LTRLAGPDQPRKPASGRGRGAAGAGRLGPATDAAWPCRRERAGAAKRCAQRRVDPALPAWWATSRRGDDGEQTPGLVLAFLLASVWPDPKGQDAAWRLGRAAWRDRTPAPAASRGRRPDAGDRGAACLHLTSALLRTKKQPGPGEAIMLGPEIGDTPFVSGWLRLHWLALAWTCSG